MLVETNRLYSTMEVVMKKSSFFAILATLALSLSAPVLADDGEAHKAEAPAAAKEEVKADTHTGKHHSKGKGKAKGKGKTKAEAKATATDTHEGEATK